MLWFRQVSNREKGRHPRVVPHQTRPVEVHLSGKNFIEVLQAADISESGIGIRVGHGFEGYDLDHEVEIVIALPGGPSFLARGRVRSKSVRGNVHVFGVEFHHLDPTGRRRLAEYVERMLLLGHGT